jgi:hypothetical protein
VDVGGDGDINGDGTGDGDGNSGANGGGKPMKIRSNIGAAFGKESL